MKDMKYYMLYEHPTEHDIRTVAETYSMDHLYDFICIEGLQDYIWDEYDWEDLDNAEKVNLFLEIQKYPSIAMRELDKYIAEYGWIVDALMESYDEYQTMSDPSIEEIRESVLRLVIKKEWTFLAEGIENVISEYEMDIHEMPATAKALKILSSLTVS